MWHHHPLKLWPTYPVYLYHFREFRGTPPYLEELKDRVHRALRSANSLATGSKRLPLAYDKLVLFVVDPHGLPLKKSDRDPNKFKCEHVPAERLTPVRLEPGELEELWAGTPEEMHARVLDRLVERIVRRVLPSAAQREA